MVRDTARQLGGGRGPQGAGGDLGQREADMLGRQDQVAGERQLEAAADRHAVQRRDHRLVEVGELLQPAEPADAVVAVGALRALGGGLEVPAGAEELLAAAGDDRDPKGRVVAEGGEGAAELAAGGDVDGVGLGPVEHDLQDAVGGGGPDCIAHALAPMRIRTSAATAPLPTGRTIRGLMSSSTSRSPWATAKRVTASTVSTTASRSPGGRPRK